MKKIILPLLIVSCNIAFAQNASTPALSVIDSINNAFNAHDIKTYVSYFADDAVFYNVADYKVETKGKRAIENLYNGWFYLIPDFSTKVNNRYINGNTVIEEFEMSGTVKALLPGYSENLKDKTFNVKVCSVSVFENDKVKSLTIYYDYLSMLNQLGWTNIVPGH